MRALRIFLVFILCLGLAGCRTSIHGIDELKEKAEKEIPVSYSGNAVLQYAGMYRIDNRAIAWFIAGNDSQEHYYLPLEIEIKGSGDDFTFIHTYKPITERCTDTAAVIWKGGYVFLINNPDAAAVQVTSADGEITREVIPDESIPYSFYVSPIPAEYVFLDAAGNEIR